MQGAEREQRDTASVIPSIAERAIDAATDVSRTTEDVTAALKIAVERLREVIAKAERPGQPIARLRAATRQAPLQSLFVAFLARDRGSAQAYPR